MGLCDAQAVIALMQIIDSTSVDFGLLMGFSVKFVGITNKLLLEACRPIRRIGQRFGLGYLVGHEPCLKSRVPLLSDRERKL